MIADINFFIKLELFEHSNIHIIKKQSNFQVLKIRDKNLNSYIS